MLDRVKDGGLYIAVERHALDRKLLGKTCLLAGHTHTHKKLRSFGRNLNFSKFQRRIFSAVKLAQDKG